MLRSGRRLRSKLCDSAAEAIKSIKSRSSIIIGGFGLAGVPFSLIKAITRSPSINGLWLVSNTAGTEHHGLSLLLRSGQTAKITCSYIGDNKFFEQMYLKGKVELELVPQGTLAERIRCGGAGIDFFTTPTGSGTLVELGGFVQKYSADGLAELISQPKPTIVSQSTGKRLLLEPAIRADVALVKAFKADETGNLVFNKSAFNFNGDAARAAKHVIAEVEHLVPSGSIDPNFVHLPGIFVDTIVLTEEKEKPFEKIVNKKTISRAKEQKSGKSLKRMRIAKRAAQELFDGANINLGVGIPTLIPSFADPSFELNIHAENGILGVSDYPDEGQEDPDLINPGKEPITVKDSASFFSSADSFGIVRGGHLDITYLGAMEVDENGDLANWVIPGKALRGMGGAMDLVGSGSRVIVLTEHKTKNDTPKIRKICQLPLTGYKCVSKIITELAVFEVLPDGKGLLLTDIAEDTTLNHVISSTECTFTVADNLRIF